MGHRDHPLPGVLRALAGLQKVLGALSRENTARSTLLPPMMSFPSPMHGPEELTASSNIPEAVPQGRQVTARPQGSSHQQPQLVQLPRLAALQGIPVPLLQSSAWKPTRTVAPALRDLLSGHTGLQSCQVAPKQLLLPYRGQKLWPGPCSVPTIIVTHVHPPASP